MLDLSADALGRISALIVAAVFVAIVGLVSYWLSR